MPSILNKTSCYLVGNLESEDYNKAKNWRDYFRNEAAKMGIICYSPLDKVLKNFDTETEGLKEKLQGYIKQRKLTEVHKYKNIRRRDLSLVDHATFVVCFLDSSKPTYGTLEELTRADFSKKKVYVIVKNGIENTPIWLAWMFPPEWFFDSFEDVLDELHCINNGFLDTNPKYWKIFREEYSGN